MSLLIFSLLGWVSSPALQRFPGGPLPSGKTLAQVLGMHSADGLQCHPLQGSFHWQRAIHPRSHPVLEWSTSSDRFIWEYESLVMSVQYVTILASHFSLGAASGIRWGHCWAALYLLHPFLHVSFPSLSQVFNPRAWTVCMPNSGAVCLLGNPICDVWLRLNHSNLFMDLDTLVGLLECMGT